MGSLQKKMPKVPKISTKLKQGNAPIGGNSPKGGKAPKNTAIKVMVKQPQAIKSPKIQGQK